MIKEGFYLSHIPDDTHLGKYVVIEDNVTIGKNVSIGHHTTILKGTQIGDNVTIGCHCVLGIKPATNARMRKSSTGHPHLNIQPHTRIGHVVSVYSGTQINKGVFIGDHASIRENVLIGEETVIGRAAIVELNTVIGKSCTIQTQAYITGDTILEDHVFIGPCVSMSNDKYMGAKEYSLKGPYIKTGAKVGNNASLLPGVVIGTDTIIGAGAVVTRDIDDGIVAAGIPAKKLNR